MPAPATASIAATTTQKYQYSQPTLNPAQLPSPSREKLATEPDDGRATAISPIARMTRIISTPDSA